MGELKQQAIGKVNINLSFYPGEDFYCDGAIEDELLEVVKSHSEVEFPEIIETRKNWEFLYHLSTQRENIVDWLPMDKGTKVLEVGSGCGAITGALTRKAGQVTCIDLSKKRSLINAYRHMNEENLEIIVGNFKDIEPVLPTDYDYICLIGVFEYGQAYMGADKPFHRFLEILRKHLAPNGRIVIAIENRFGLKYWAGCQEDHLGTYFSGIEGYPDGGVVRTFTRKGLEEIFKETDLEEYSFYYPYPDYKFPTQLYSDDYLPKTGELSDNLRNFDRDRMLLFDEKKVFDSILKEGEFPLYSNSYLVILGPSVDTKYVKYSNDRKLEFRMRTEIADVIDDDTAKKKRIVRKYPLCEEAEPHIRNIVKSYEGLKERYEGGKLQINQAGLVEEDDSVYTELEYLQGRTLAEYMDACVEKQDPEGFLSLFRQYIELVDYHPESKISDYDLIFSNIIIDEKDTWTVIDYEWTFEEQIGRKELGFRAIYCYLLEDKKRNKLSADIIFDELGIEEEDAEEFRKKELQFQRYVTGNRRSMKELRDLIGYKMLDPHEWRSEMNAVELRRTVRIYTDMGRGYSEDTAYYVLAKEDVEGMHIQIPLERGTAHFRFDPAMEPCILTLKEIKVNGAELDFSVKNKEPRVDINGLRLENGNCFVFNHEDPYVSVRMIGIECVEGSEFSATWQISSLTKEMADAMDQAGRRRFRL